MAVAFWGRHLLVPSPMALRGRWVGSWLCPALAPWRALSWPFGRVTHDCADLCAEILICAQHPRLSEGKSTGPTCGCTRRPRSLISTDGISRDRTPAGQKGEFWL